MTPSGVFMKPESRAPVCSDPIVAARTNQLIAAAEWYDQLGRFVGAGRVFEIYVWLFTTLSTEPEKLFFVPLSGPQINSRRESPVSCRYLAEHAILVAMPNLAVEIHRPGVPPLPPALHLSLVAISGAELEPLVRNFETPPATAETAAEAYRP
ncbi:MAG: hypothetical protein V1821_03340 [bacterium]